MCEPHLQGLVLCFFSYVVLSPPYTPFHEGCKVRCCLRMRTGRQTMRKLPKWKIESMLLDD